MIRQVFNLFFVVISYCGLSQSVLDNFIFSMCTAEEVRHAQIGVSVFDVDKGMVVGAYNHDKSFIPASSLKLLTSYIILDKLGKEFTYNTKLAYSGHITDSVLHGNLYIIGSGDPSLGSKRFSDRPQLIELMPYIVNKIKNVGINKIEGSVISDESVFDSYPISPSWQWDDLGSYYASGAWGININENEYELWYNTNKLTGEPADLLQIYPAISDLKITSEVKVNDEYGDDEAYIFGGPYVYDKKVVGSIPHRTNAFKIRGSMPDPPKYLAQALHIELAKQGINSHSYFSQYYNHGKTTGLTVFDSITSPPLLELVKQSNYHSINLYSEAFLKTIGYHLGFRGSGTEGIKMIEKYLTESGIDPKVLNMEDGSGLSARNRVSPFLLNQLLYLQIKKHGIEYVAEVLPKAGEEGTVRRLLKKSPAYGKVWMKSGSMNQIMTYTGIMKAKSGSWLAFSIMSNGYTQKPSEMRMWMETIIEGIYLNG
jgi:D-alanyl-D-alanine carboxypeptidase/D-alanyl-D-alanine-endopeptidase (penicillin-binding protein 4)